MNTYVKCEGILKPSSSLSTIDHICKPQYHSHHHYVDNLHKRSHLLLSLVRHVSSVGTFCRRWPRISIVMENQNKVRTPLETKSRSTNLPHCRLVPFAELISPTGHSSGCQCQQNDAREQKKTTWVDSVFRRLQGWKLQLHSSYQTPYSSPLTLHHLERWCWGWYRIQAKELGKRIDREGGKKSLFLKEKVEIMTFCTRKTRQFVLHALAT